MRTDPNQPICGLSPSVLRALLKRDLFSTPAAMKVLSLDEPDASTTMISLWKEGWIEFEGMEDYVDWWCTSARGRRFVAARLVRPVPVAEGRKVVESLVAEARLVNAEPSSSRRIALIRVLGSILTAEEGEHIGDVEVVVDVQRRGLGQQEMEQLEREERRDMPADLNFEAQLLWPEQRIMWRLAGMSHFLRLHPASDMDEPETPYRTIYAFDVDAGQEVPQDFAIWHSGPARKSESDGASLPLQKWWPGPQPWPPAPKRNFRVRIEEESGHLAQHMWQNRAYLRTIARQIKMPESQVQAYLAGRSHALPAIPTPVDGAFKRTILRALPTNRSYFTLVSARVSGRRGPLIKIDLLDYDSPREVASARWVPSRYIVGNAQGALIPDLERVLKALIDWLARISDLPNGFELFLSTACHADEEAVDRTAPMISFLRLAPDLTRRLGEIWPHPRGRLEESDYLCQVILSADQPRVHVSDRRSEQRAIPDERVQSIAELMKEFRDNYADVFEDEARWFLLTRGEMLE